MNLYGLRGVAICWFERAMVLGIFLVLAGLVLFPSSSRYHTFYYLFVLAPAVFMVSLKPEVMMESCSVLFSCVLLFLFWTSLSVFWNDSDKGVLFSLTRSLYVLSLFIIFAVVVRMSRDVFLKTLIVAGFFVVALSLYSFIGFFEEYRSGRRFIGGGALRNPLLSSHIFGFFLVVFTVLLFSSRSWKMRLACSLFALSLFVFIVATGSRTPLAALVAASVWVVVVQRNKKAISTLGVFLAALLGVFVFYPEVILSRGLSFRPELWGVAIDKILEKPAWGYGFYSDAGFYLPVLDTMFREPHNIHLSVLYFLGVVGLSLWCFMHAHALWSCWKQKNSQMYLIGGTLLVYGASAGMFEGGWLLPKINEHWFITWIPLAFVSALMACDRFQQPAPVDLLAAQR